MNIYHIGIIGNWNTDLDSQVYEAAKKVGGNIAQRKHILVTGGGTGVMEAAMLGARKFFGHTIGILPSDEENNYPYIGQGIVEKIPTAMGEVGRMPLLVQRCHGIIVIGGKSGTANESLMGYHFSKPQVILRGFGGLPERMYPQCLDSEGYLDDRKKARILFADEPIQAVDMLLAEIEKIKV